MFVERNVQEIFLDDKINVNVEQTGREAKYSNLITSTSFSFSAPREASRQEESIEKGNYRTITMISPSFGCILRDENQQNFDLLPGVVAISWGWRTLEISNWDQTIDAHNRAIAKRQRVLVLIAGSSIVRQNLVSVFGEGLRVILRRYRSVGNRIERVLEVP